MLQKLPISFFDTHTHGEIMSRLSNDIENVSSTISQSTIQLMSGVITVLGSLIMMLILSPLLTLASIVTVPLVFLLTRTIAKNTSVLFKEQQTQLGILNGHIEETISGIAVVKAFNHEQKAIEEFDEVNAKLCDVGLKALIWSGYLMPLMNVINNFGFAMVAAVGGALVGPTGAGKTTIVNLLTRFYVVTEGQILIDGIDIRKYTRDSLRKCFGIVLQDTYLFSGTIKENIKYGNLDATDKEIETAAEMANADVFIRRLPNGYDTVLSESGSNLSQGQRQLLAIASGNRRWRNSRKRKP